SATYAVVPMRQDGTVDAPLPLFAGALTGVGLADLPFNPFDSTVRRARLSYDTEQGQMETFAAAMFSAATGVSAAKSVEEQASPPGAWIFRASPFSGRDEVMIRFAGPPGEIGGKGNAFRTYSASMVERGLIPASWLEDKIVLVGASYEDLKDAYLTPYYARATGFARMNGVEIHANILSSLLTRQYYYAMRQWQAAAWAFAAALAVALAAGSLSPWKSSLAWLLISALWAALSVWLFSRWALVAPMVAPFVAQTTALGAGLGWRALTEGRERRFVRGVFARYVPEAVVERMTENPALLKLGGETRQVTSLFSDIASFTSISERLDPQGLVAFLNRYLGLMNEALFRHGATLDKYEGDAIIAFFNAPLDLDSHEERAARAAMEMRRADAVVSAEWGQRCGRQIITRIGLASGPAVVGNMGSEGRFDYTAIGDTINLASRLEGANKFYGTRVMASEATVRGLADDIARRPLDILRVKGKAEPILVYEIVGKKVEVEAEVEKKEMVARYVEAFGLFRARRIEAAMEELKGALAARPDDQPSRELMKRCERALREPEWDLVTELTAK
ncbi:MAG: adenylate/guanylate cyclase domain-containing protein, partial [Proteobacteria bacterium]|nr:adenylate/guanylate cyclase domain-containing protein [Pseudomonadota bacterium]